MTLDDRRFDHHKMHALTGADRQARWDPPRFLERFDIRPGQTVLDLGSVPVSGRFPSPIKSAHKVRSGLWTSARKCWMNLRNRDPPKQVRLLRSELPKIDLPDSSIDWIWTAFVFHEVTPPQELAKEMFRLAKAEGVVAVLEWRPDLLGEGGAPRHHRLSVEQVTGFLRDAGFNSVKKTWQDDETVFNRSEKIILRKSAEEFFISTF